MKVFELDHFVKQELVELGVNGEAYDQFDDKGGYCVC